MLGGEEERNQLRKPVPAFVHITENILDAYMITRDILFCADWLN